jgi:hypothetical protein
VRVFRLNARPAQRPDAIAVRGKNVTLYYHPDDVPCAGTLAYLDVNVDAIGEYLGLPIVSSIPYHYRKDIPCPVDAVGCALGGADHPITLWSTTPDTYAGRASVDEPARRGDSRGAHTGCPPASAPDFVRVSTMRECRVSLQCDTGGIQAVNFYSNPNGSPDWVQAQRGLCDYGWP